MSCTQFRCIRVLILRHAWLNLWDKHMTTGRINQVTLLSAFLFLCKTKRAHTRSGKLPSARMHWGGVFLRGVRFVCYESCFSTDFFSQIKTTFSFEKETPLETKKRRKISASKRSDFFFFSSFGAFSTDFIWTKQQRNGLRGVERGFEKKPVWCRLRLQSARSTSQVREQLTHADLLGWVGIHMFTRAGRHTDSSLLPFWNSQWSSKVGVLFELSLLWLASGNSHWCVSTFVETTRR